MILLSLAWFPFHEHHHHRDGLVAVVVYVSDHFFFGPIRQRGTSE
jgi:hypothetical protein